MLLWPNKNMHMHNDRATATLCYKPTLNVSIFVYNIFIYLLAGNRECTIMVFINVFHSIYQLHFVYNNWFGDKQ